MKYSLIFVICLSLGLWSCGNDGQGNQNGTDQNTTDNVVDSTAIEEETPPEVRNPIELKTWELQSYTHNGNSVPKYNFPKPLTLNLDWKSFNGFAGCNNYRGTLSLGEGVISMTQISKTKKACPSEMVHEVRFLELLEAAETYEANLANLVIKSGDLGTLQFRVKSDK